MRGCNQAHLLRCLLRRSLLRDLLADRLLRLRSSLDLLRRLRSLLRLLEYDRRTDLSFLLSFLSLSRELDLTASGSSLPIPRASALSSCSLLILGGGGRASSPDMLN
jgi:hypothetical protein